MMDKMSLVIFLMIIITGAQNNLVLTISFSPNTGVCQHYTGKCRTLLNSSEPRFINKTIGYNGTESVATALLEAVEKIYNKKMQLDKKQTNDDVCKPILEKSVCFFVFPLCSSQQQKMDICREDCDYLYELCGKDLDHLVGVGQFLLFGKLSGIVFHFEECKDLRSEKDTSCSHLPFLDVPKTTNKDSNSLHMKMVIVLAVLLPLTAFVVLILCLYHRRLSKREKLHSFDYENGRKDTSRSREKGSNVVSMKERIQEWKVAPSELIELMDICKSRGVLEIPVDKIEYLKDLGSGQFGLVFQGRVNENVNVDSCEIVAVKTLREGSSHEAIKEFCQEVNIMSTFSHPNLVQLIGVSLSDEPYCMIFEFVEYGDLANFLRKCNESSEDESSAYPKLSTTDQLSMAVQIASGMKYISSISCVHRDLAARNCLVGRGLVVKISDFGLSRDIYVSEYYKMDKTRMLPVRWLPPEAFVDGKFTTYSDVYSYGIVLWEIFTFAKLPYEDHDNKRAMDFILKGNLLEKPKQCPPAIYDIMLQCWHYNPELRILFPDIINELCSLDDFGQRFHTNISEQIQENFKARSFSNKSKLNADFENKVCDINDEQPINVQRSPHEPITKKKGNPYTILNKPGAPTDNVYDGIVTLSDVGCQKHPETERQDLDTPTLKDNYDNDGSIPICRNINDFDTPETFANLTERGDDDNDVCSCMKQKPEHERHFQEAYDVPTTSHDYPDGPEKTYDIPPTSHDVHDGEDTYDIPPKHDDDQQEAHEDAYNNIGVSSKQSPNKKNETEDVNRSDEGNDVSWSTDDVDDIYENSAIFKPTFGSNSVPESPCLNRTRNDDDDIYENSVESKSTIEHYSVPKSSFLEGEINTHLPQTSPTARHVYENVDLDREQFVSP